MHRLAFFIDGFNLYHSLEDDPNLHQYKWLDLAALARNAVPQGQIAHVLYFTAYTDWNPGKVAKHKLFVRAQRARGVEVVYGKFRKRQKECGAYCHMTYETYEEKYTDVNIAVKLIELAVLDQYDTAVILTGDCDIVPGVQAVKRLFPAKKLHALVPIGPRGRYALDIVGACHSHLSITERLLQKSLLPDPLVLPNGAALACPTGWKPQSEGVGSTPPEGG